MKIVKQLLPSLLLISSTTTLAEKVDGFYLGAGYGSFSYDIVQDWDNDSGYGKLIEKTEGNTLKLYGGYQFNKVIAIEATYTDYGDTQGYIYNLFNNKQIVEQSPSSFSIAANVGYSFDNGLRPFALLGLSYITLDSSYSFLETDNPIAIKYGIGLDYAPMALQGVQVRIAYEVDSYFAEAYNGYGDDVNIDIFSLQSFYAGISYKF